MAIGALAASCSRGKLPLAPAPEAAPTASSPALAIRRFEWAVNHRDIDAFDDLFSDDFEFISAGTDSTGPARTTWGGRDTVLAALRGLLIGSPGRPPAESITLFFDQNLIAFPDTRPGKVSRWHKQIRTSVDLKVRIDPGNLVEVTGNALFFLTRGDSAEIPRDLRDRGFKPDSLRWWIDRWEDETLGGGIPALGSALARGPRAAKAPPASTNPARKITFAAILRFYLP